MTIRTYDKILIENPKKEKTTGNKELFTKMSVYRMAQELNS